MREIYEVKNRIRNKQNKPNKIKVFLYKMLFLIIIFITLTIFVNYNPKLKKVIYEKVYNSNISFSKIKKEYLTKIGKIIPFQNNFTEKKVFNEKLSYKSLSKYNKGVKLYLEDNYLIPSINEGIVIFNGKKDDKNTIIIQQPNKIDVWYSNLNNTNVKLYDYVDKNQIIGEAKNNELYLSFYKDGVEIDYKKIIK